jgi:tetratricopeptide (TPR) repeat protein
VLYAVQRMAQLAALFTLAAVLVYLVARQQLADGRSRIAALNLFVSFPLLLLLGLFSKQNAAIAPFLCLVLELAFFLGRPGNRRVLAGFFAVFAVLPALGAVALLVIAPERLLGGYHDYDFTLWQRLLTQPRALLDYIGMWFVPRGPRMGLYTDDFAVSTGLLSPPSTLFALLALLAASALAIAVRRRAPCVFAGWFFFLVAHAVESSFLPLDLYFEHRNYLPSFGLLLMACGLLGMLRWPAGIEPARLRRLGVLAVTATLAVLAFATFGRVGVWQSEQAIIEQAIEQHPRSMRAHLDAASHAMARANWDQAVAALAPALQSESEGDRFVAQTATVVLDCIRGHEVFPESLRAAVRQAPAMITVRELYVAEVIQQAALKRLCRYLPNEELGNALSSMLDSASSQTDSSVTKSAVRSIALQVYASDGHWDHAESLAKTDWQARPRLKSGWALAYVYAHNGKPGQARELINQLQSMVPPRDSAWERRLDELETTLPAR